MSSVARGESSETTPRQPAKMTPADLASRGILQILWRRQLILFLSIVVCVVTAIIYVSQATPIYASLSRISIENQTNTIVGNMLIPTGSGADYLATQCEVITSTPTVNDAVKLNNVMQLKSLANVDNPVGAIRGSLTAGVGRGTQIIQVSYESPY